MSDRFVPTVDGLRVRLVAEELDVLRRLPEELRDLYESDGGPVRDRLFPRAYLDPTEEDSEREWQSLVHPDLLAQRLEVLAEFSATLDRFEGSGRVREAVLVDSEPDTWLGLFNDARLALGTRLGVTEDTDLESVPPDDPDAASYAVYGWLTWLQGELVEAILD